MQWHPQLENGELLKAGEAAGFDVMVTSDQNIKYQQNLSGRKLALVVLGSNIWPIVRAHGAAIKSAVDAASLSRFAFEQTRPALGGLARCREQGASLVCSKAKRVRQLRVHRNAEAAAQAPAK